MLAQDDGGLTIQEIAAAVGYHANTPWAVASIVGTLERAGSVTRDRDWRVTITKAGCRALELAGDGEGES